MPAASGVEAADLGMIQRSHLFWPLLAGSRIWQAIGSMPTAKFGHIFGQEAAIIQDILGARAPSVALDRIADARTLSADTSGPSPSACTSPRRRRSAA